MNEFSVRFGTMNSVAGKLEVISQQLDVCVWKIDNVKGSLSLETRARGGLEQSLRATVESTSIASKKAKILSSALKEAYICYRGTEGKLCGEIAFLATSNVAEVVYRKVVYPKELVTDASGAFKNIIIGMPA